MKDNSLNSENINVTVNPHHEYLVYRASINVKLDSEAAILPKFATPGSSCFDLHSVDSLILDPGDRALVSTGLRFELLKGFELQVKPRSGLAIKHGITVLNSPGIVDSDYRGVVKVILINHGKESFKIEVGDRIAQANIVPVLVHVNPVVFNVVDELSETSRGEGGFGHTGVSNKTNI